MNNDEIFFNTLARTAGEQAADLLQRLGQLHGEKIIAHQPADRLAGKQVGGKGFE
ncbi:hypothetical protein D3C77_456060 [compost metagenome]